MTDDAAYWAEIEREADARSQVLAEMDGQIIDLNEVERRVRKILADDPS